MCVLQQPNVAPWVDFEIIEKTKILVCSCLFPMTSFFFPQPVTGCTVVWGVLWFSFLLHAAPGPTIDLSQAWGTGEHSCCVGQKSKHFLQFSLSPLVTLRLAQLPKLF